MAWNTLHAGGWNAARVILQATSLILLARLFGPKGYGALSGTVGLYTTLAQLVGLGTGIALVRHVVRGGDVRARLRSTQAAYFLTGLLCFAIAWPGSVWLFPRGMLSGTALAMLGLAEIVVAPSLLPLAYRYQASERMSIAGALLTTAPFARCAAIVAVWILHVVSLQWFAAIYLAALLVATTLAGVLLWPRGGIPTSREPIAAAMRDGLPYAVTNATVTAGGELDKTVMLHQAGATLTGQYAAASRIAMAALLPVNALVVAAAPRWFRQDRQHRMLSASAPMFAAAAAYAVVASGSLLLLAPYLPLLLGDSFQASVPLLRYLCLAILTGSFRQIVGMLLTAKDLQRSRNGIEILSVVLGLCLMGLLIPALGAVGAIISVVVSDVSLVVFGWEALRRANKREPACQN